MVDGFYSAQRLNQERVESSLKGFCDDVDFLVETNVLTPCEEHMWNIVLCGSSVPIYYGVTYRNNTEDIDIVRQQVVSEIIALYPKYNMNTGPMAFIAAMPFNYEDRLVEVVSSKYMMVYRPSWEDLIFSKLLRYETQDKMDIKGIIDNHLIKWEMLEYLVTDKEESLGSGMTEFQYKQFVYNYNCLFHEYD